MNFNEKEIKQRSIIKNITQTKNYIILLLQTEEKIETAIKLFKL